MGAQKRSRGVFGKRIAVHAAAESSLRSARPAGISQVGFSRRFWGEGDTVGCDCGSAAERFGVAKAGVRGSASADEGWCREAGAGQSKWGTNGVIQNYYFGTAGTRFADYN
jgi:hypothetical protein